MFNKNVVLTGTLTGTHTILLLLLLLWHTAVSELHIPETQVGIADNGALGFDSELGSYDYH